MRVLPIALFAVAAHAAQASVVDRKRATRDLQDDITADDDKNEPPRCGVPGTPCCHAASGKNALPYPCLDGTGCDYDTMVPPYEIGMCTTTCGGEDEPCCYSVTSTDDEDEYTCDCAPGLFYNIGAKVCTPCGVAGTPPCPDTNCPVGQVRDESRWLLFSYITNSQNSIPMLLPFILSIILTGPGNDNWVRRASETETPFDTDQIEMDQIEMETLIENFSPQMMFGGKGGPGGLLGEPICVPCGELGQLPCAPCGKGDCPPPQCSEGLEVTNLIGYIGDNTGRGMTGFPIDNWAGLVPPPIYYLFLGINICLPNYNYCDPMDMKCLIGGSRASLNATAADPTPVPPEATESTTPVPPEPTD